MTDTIQTPIASQQAVIKLRDALAEVLERVSSTGSTEISTAMSEAIAAFRRFYLYLGNPEFQPEELRDGDTVRSEVYNRNLRSLYNDISRFYNEIQALADSQLQSYNYASIVTSEIKKRADGLASIVLDLNILNNFTRGDVLIAGDDFRNLDNVDIGAGSSSSQAELLSNGSGVGLARSGSNNLTSNPNIKVNVIPISPADTQANGLSVVNSSPTPGNFRRFYEGNYYNFIGLARPEGGRFNIKFLVDPDQVQQAHEGDFDPTDGTTLFVDLGASEEQKLSARLKMFDGDPSTFWECEYLIKLPTPLVGDIQDSVVVENNDTNNPDGPQSAATTIDAREAEQRAQEFDTADLVVDLVVTLPELTSINFVALNPVIFGSYAFMSVEDIATADDETGQFITVDGWQSLRFPKTITPEANEFLTDSQVAASLSPNRYNYTGQGVYPFPVRQAKLIKIRLSIQDPVPSMYERTYALLKKVVDIDTTTTTTTSRGLFR